MDSPSTAVDSYFAHARSEIEPLLPSSATRILEIGCSSGATLAWLKQRWPDAEMIGVDGHAPLKSTIEQRADRAIIHDLEQPLPDLGAFDLILALDVLEHLRSPEIVLRDLASRLKAKGVCIVSVPNVAEYAVSLPLLFKRQFRYVDAGTLDRTHLRWFTEETAIELMHSAGLSVAHGCISGFDGQGRRVFDAVTLGVFRHYLAKQYLMRGEKTAQAGPVQWKRTCELPPWKRLQR